MLDADLRSGTSLSWSPDGRYIAAADIGELTIRDADSFRSFRKIRFAPGIRVVCCDLRNLHPESELSGEVKERLYEYGAITDGLS